MPNAASAAVPYDRTPPSNLDAEVSVIGSMLLSRDAIAEVTEVLLPDDFYRGAHRTMYEAIRDLYDRGEPVDAVLLSDELSRRGQLDDVGGALAIADLLDKVPTAANALYYARIVSEHAIRRRLIDVGTAVTRLGYEIDKGADEALDTAEAMVFEIAQQRQTSEFTLMKDLVNEAWVQIEERYENKQSITGLATGFHDFDQITQGLQPQNLVILAARPAMGKSTLVMNIAAHVCVEQRRPVLIFSLEMSKNEIVQRLLSAEARIPSDKLRTGRFDDNDWPKLSQAVGRLAEAPMYIDDTPGVTLMEIRSKARRLKAKHGLDLLIVDYLQLMQSHKKTENRVQEVSELSRGLKILAKELDIPVVALSQLSRRPEERPDKRPQLADLRESGSIEQDADIVTFIYRDEVYDPDSAAKGEAELILAKHRNGPLGVTRLSFIGHHSRFASMARSGMTSPGGGSTPPAAPNAL